MAVDFISINVFLTQSPWNAKKVTYLNQESEQFLEIYKSRWYEYVRNGLLNSESDLDNTTKMIDDLVTFIGQPGCKLSEHLKNWKRELSIRPDAAWENGAHQDAMNDIALIEIQLGGKKHD